ncbi:MAG: adenylate cyclase [Verrucomicrobiales bacterium]|jgi:adenylate cyclase
MLTIPQRLDRSMGTPGHRSILVVDDQEGNLQVVGTALSEEGYDVVLASSGEQALERIEARRPDLVLLDVIMPNINGIEVCNVLKSRPETEKIPIIFLSAADEKSIILKGLAAGGVDYVTKPFHKAELLSRVRTHLELQQARRRADDLLASILPEEICVRLKRGERNIVDHFPEATVVFADIVGFTPASAELPPQEIVEWLNSVFSSMDVLTVKHSVQKIKTIGDAYMVASGVPTPRSDHAERAVNFALDLVEKADQMRGLAGDTLTLRIGINSGALVAGVIGESRFAYDLWGDTVNTAQRLEESCEPGRIHISSATREQLSANHYQFDARPAVEIRGKRIEESVFVRRK